jgi:hypothetical protein
MPTEQQYQGLTFRDSRDYKGDNFRAYLQPDTFEGRQAVFGRAAWEEWIDEGRLTPIMEPFPFGIEGVNTQSGRPLSPAIITNSVVSPLPSKKGSYLDGTQTMVYYWIDGMQYNTLYRLIPFSQVNFDMLLDRDKLLLRQKILVKITEWLGGLVDKLKKESESETDLNFLIIFRKWATRYGIVEALGVWVMTARVAEPISVVTSAAQNEFNAIYGIDDTTSGGTTGKMNTDFLGLLVSGVGIFTGNPLLIGGGLVLSFIQNRNNGSSYRSVAVPTVDTTTPLQRFTGRIS